MSQTVLKKEIIFHSPMFQKMYYGFPIPILINSKMHTGNNPKNIFQYLLCYIVQYSIYVPQNNRVIDFQLQLAHRIPFVMLTNAFRFRFFLNCCNILANCKENSIFGIEFGQLWIYTITTKAKTEARRLLRSKIKLILSFEANSAVQ